MMSAVQPSGDRWATPGSLAEPELEPAAPGAPPPPGTATGTSAATVAGRRGRSTEDLGGSLATAGPLDERDTGDVPHIRLQPMTVADILDGAFGIIKARPARLLGIAALFVVPVHLLAAYLQRDAFGDAGMWDALTSNDPAVIAEAESTSGAQVAGSVLALVVPALALVCVAAAIAKLVGGWTVGHDAKAGELLRAVGRRWWALLASYVLVHLAEGVGLVGIYVGAAFVMAVFVVTAPVIGAEDVGPIAAMGRSARLTGRRYWPVLGTSLLIGLVSFLLTQALGGLPQALAVWVGLDVAWPLLAAGNIVGAVLTTPFVAAATVLLYLDLRVRNEGLDIELTARDLVDDAAA
jgi:hypothetical protein